MKNYSRKKGTPGKSQFRTPSRLIASASVHAHNLGPAFGKNRSRVNKKPI